MHPNLVKEKNTGHRYRTVARHLSDESVAVGDVRFLVLLLPIPEVQFNAAAPRQQDLPVHLQAGSTYVCMYLQLE